MRAPRGRVRVRPAGIGANIIHLERADSDGSSWPRPSRQQGGSPNLPSLQKIREAILDRMGFSEADRPALGHSPVSVFPNAQSSSGPSLGSTGPLDRQPYRPPILSNVTLIKIIPRIAQRTLINLAIEDAMTGEESSCKKCFPQTAS
jgi:hypothetical protein